MALVLNRAGVDVVPEFIDEARRAHDGLEFRLGDARRLDETAVRWNPCVDPRWIQFGAAAVDVRSPAPGVRTGGGLAILRRDRS